MSNSLNVENKQRVAKRRQFLTERGWQRVSIDIPAYLVPKFKAWLAENRPPIPSASLSESRLGKQRQSDQGAGGHRDSVAGRRSI